MIRRHAVYSTRGADLRQQREHLGLSLRYVARKSGYSASYVRRLEAGAPLPVDTAAVLDATLTRARMRMGGAR